jgi:hypothetical protein
MQKSAKVQDLNQGGANLTGADEILIAFLFEGGERGKRWQMTA